MEKGAQCHPRGIVLQVDDLGRLKRVGRGAHHDPRGSLLQADNGGNELPPAAVPGGRVLIHMAVEYSPEPRGQAVQ